MGVTGWADWVWYQWAAALGVTGVIWGLGGIVIAVVFGRMIALADEQEGTK